MSSSLGNIFRITTWGESHGKAVGVVIDGCPAKTKIDLEAIQFELDRRRPGQSKIVTQRKEGDKIEILSGVENGISTGTPISMLVWNEDQRSKDYDELNDRFRPSHADYSYQQKYGLRSVAGGGRASARETIGRVAAGAIAKEILKQKFGVEVLAWVESIHDIKANIDAQNVTLDMIESNPVRCPDPETAQKMIERIEAVRKNGDSIGGVIAGLAKGVPAGWGEPIFDKLEAELAKAIMSLPACKGFESGSGFGGTLLHGSEHNDEFFVDDERNVKTYQNNSGGIQGGISNGMPITIRAAFKPTATIMKAQKTVNLNLDNVSISGKGRHDPCVLPRAVPMVEAMMALILVDHALRQEAIR